MTDILNALKSLGTCLRESRSMFYGVPAENVCVQARAEIERLTVEVERLRAKIMVLTAPSMSVVQQNALRKE